MSLNRVCMIGRLTRDPELLDAFATYQGPWSDLDGPFSPARAAQIGDVRRHDLHEIANIPRRRREGARRSNHAPTRLDVLCEALLGVALLLSATVFLAAWACSDGGVR